MTAVPVPATPAGAEEGRRGVLPGELARWRVGTSPGDLTLVLGVRSGKPWVAILGGLGGGPMIEEPDRLAVAADALRTAQAWMVTTATDHPVDPHAEQPSLFEETAR